MIAASVPLPLPLLAQTITNPSQCTGGYENNLDRYCLWQDSKDGATSGGGAATCTAKELTVTNARITGITGAPQEPCCADPSQLCYRCTPGQTVEGSLVLDISVNADARYNIGLWVQQGTQQIDACTTAGNVNGMNVFPAYCGVTCSKNTLRPGIPPVVDGETRDDIDRFVGARWVCAVPVPPKLSTRLCQVLR